MGGYSVCNCPSAHYRVPSTRDARITTEPALGRISLAFPLLSLWPLAHIFLLAGPIQAASLGGSHPGPGIQLLPKMLSQVNLWITPSLHLPHPENEASTPRPHRMSGWKDLGPHVGTRNLTRNLAFPCPSRYSSFFFIRVQERAASRRRGTEGREGTPCHQMTKGQRIPECQPCTMHAAIY